MASLDPTEQSPDSYADERHSALIAAAMHLFASLAVPRVLREHGLDTGAGLSVWIGLEIALSLTALTAVVLELGGRSRAFGIVMRWETYATAVSFASLAWLEPDLPEHSSLRFVLVVILVTVTALTSTDSTHIATGRRSLMMMIALVGLSYFLAFLVAGDLLLAAYCIMWSTAIATFSRGAFRLMRAEIDRRREVEETARHDQLTGLLTRVEFVGALERVQANATPAALVLLDLDGFKAVNDRFGRLDGDAVLREVAGRLTWTFPVGTIVGRLGGDEFAAIVPTGQGSITATIERVIAAINERVRLSGGEVFVAASAGWTTLEDATDATEAIVEADLALSRSKRSATTASTGFNAVMRQDRDRALELHQRFRGAIRRGDVTFAAQPIVSARDCAPVAVELLARWPEGDELLIESSEFSRLADETGLAIEFDQLALRQAASLLTEWRDDPELGSLVVKANVSPLHLHNLMLARSVEEIIPRQDRDRLGLELVEDQMISMNRRHHDLLREFKSMGITVSIDDFGIGYSSLAYLQSLPISEVKIDRSFVHGVHANSINQGLVGSIVSLTSTLGLTTVAEGVESEADFDQVRALGVASVQGYLTGRPRSVSRIAEDLRAARRDAATG